MSCQLHSSQFTVEEKRTWEHAQMNMLALCIYIRQKEIHLTLSLFKSNRSVYSHVFTILYIVWNAVREPHMGLKRFTGSTEIHMALKMEERLILLFFFTF